MTIKSTYPINKTRVDSLSTEDKSLIEELERPVTSSDSKPVYTKGSIHYNVPEEILDMISGPLFGHVDPPEDFDE